MLCNRKIHGVTKLRYVFGKFNFNFLFMWCKTQNHDREMCKIIILRNLMTCKFWQISFKIRKKNMMNVY